MSSVPDLAVQYKCAERDSNPHALTGTDSSSQRVYQFHHLRVERPGTREITPRPN